MIKYRDNFFQTNKKNLIVVQFVFQFLNQSRKKYRIIAFILHLILYKKNLQNVGRGLEMSASFIFYHLHRSAAIDYGKRFLKDKLANIEIIENLFSYSCEVKTIFQLFVSFSTTLKNLIHWSIRFYLNFTKVLLSFTFSEFLIYCNYIQLHEIWIVRSKLI